LARETKSCHFGKMPSPFTIPPKADILAKTNNNVYECTIELIYEAPIYL